MTLGATAKSMKRARNAVTAAFAADRELRDVLDDMPPVPKTELSIHQLGTATLHLRAALRILQEVHTREEPLFQEDDFNLRQR